MRPLAIFLLGLVLVFGALAVVIVLSRPTERAFVVVDNSFPMRAVWSQVPGALADLEGEGYSEVALATEKGLVHSWQGSFSFREPTPYAPCDLTGIDAHAEAAEADERVLITTSGSCPAEGLTEWRIIQLDPSARSS